MGGVGLLYQLKIKPILVLAGLKLELGTELGNDGADKVESLSITDAMSSNVLSFSKESSRLKRLLIDGADFIANCKG